MADDVHHGIELDEDRGWQERTWAVQRGGWVAMGLLLLAAVLGLSGSGPLAKTTTHGDGITVEHKRISRRHVLDEWTVRLAPGQGERVRLSVNGAYLDHVDIERITPEPAAAAAGSEATTFLIDVADPQREAVVRFAVRPNGPGWRRAEVAVNGGAPARLGQWIHP